MGNQSFKKRHHASRKKDGGKADQRTLTADVLPRWGSLKAGSIARSDVFVLLDDIKDPSAPVMANRVLALVRKMFNFGIQRGILQANPATVIQEPAVEIPKDRFLSEQEIKRFWHGLDQANIQETLKGGESRSGRVIRDCPSASGVAPFHRFFI
ncbi:MAG: hypothetical protein GX751_03180 [Desulfuromonadaceae bacterium]|nr:hypothetical protein [Desulfuromonadaceae bacterium]